MNDRCSRVQAAVFLAASLTLTACSGGGGGDGGATPNPAPTPAPTANQAPVANISISAAEGFAPVTISFDGSASTDSDGSISSYRWNFGDGSAAGSGASTTHTYATVGVYTASLQVTDNDGALASTTVSVQARGARLQGSVQILSSSAVDSDVNDRFTANVSNNSFAQAQPLPNPVLLGGFVNLPNTGPTDENGDFLGTGNLFVSGDASDFYAVNLAGNEIILLDIAEAGADLDLALYDAQGRVVDASLGLENTESLTVSNPGAYFVEVFPASALTNFAGASNYVLSIGQDLAPTGRAASRLSDPFVPGEVLISHAPGVDATRLHRRHGLQARQRSGAISRARVDDYRVIRGALARRAEIAQLAEEREFRLQPSQRGKYETLMAIKSLRADNEVAIAEPNLLRFAHRLPQDPFYGLQWHYPAIDLPAAWDITTGSPLGGGNDVIVAVIDTGVLLQHPDLLPQLVAGYDFISDAARAGDGDGIDDNPNDEGDMAFGGASSFHGTHVAGTVAAASDNDEGVAGVAWGAKIMPLRALGVDGGATTDVIEAVKFAAGLPNASGTLPARRADIINLSLGSGFASQLEQAVFDQVRAAGVIIVASAGNEASSVPSYPASYNGVVSVSATTINNTLAPYSNIGASIDVAAPGGYNLTDQNGDGIGDGIVSTLGDDSDGLTLQFGYAALNGTSMAAPHVAGVAALMKSVHPALTPLEFDTALMAGDLTVDLGPPGRDNGFGYGLINAQLAVLSGLALANGSGSDPGPILGASTSALNYGVLTSELDISLSNIGSGSILIESVQSDEPWLSVAVAPSDPSGLGIYTLRVDRTGLDDGSYNARITFAPEDSGTNSVTVAVIMQIATTSFTADAGLHYVILVDSNGETVGPVEVVTVEGGAYNFDMEDVPLGSYQIFAGGDMDDDAFLCDAGEACGSYQTLDAPELINVDENRLIDELNFVSEYRAVISTPAAQSSGRGGSRSSGIPLDKPRQTSETTSDP